MLQRPVESAQYKYPHTAFPYSDLIDENARRGADVPEYEVLDTGMFDDERYFDVQVEYAKHMADDILMRVTIENRADIDTGLDVLPQIWARNMWSWKPTQTRPALTLEIVNESTYVSAEHGGHEPTVITAWSPDAAQVEWLFCENDTNVRRLFHMDGVGPFKDGFNDYLLQGDENAIRRDKGTRAAARMHVQLKARGKAK